MPHGTRPNQPFSTSLMATSSSKGQSPAALSRKPSCIRLLATLQWWRDQEDLSDEGCKYWLVGTPSGGGLPVGVLYNPCKAQRHRVARVTSGVIFGCTLDLTSSIKMH